ncbi:hypothetical protein EMIT0215P_30295 [Pseudomonas serboccidentalis]
MLLYSALWLPTVSPTDFLVYSLSLWELLKVLLWSKALGMSSAFYLVAVTGDLAAWTAGRISTGKGHVHPHIVSSD